MTTSKIERIKYEWQKAFVEMSKSEGFKRILLREMNIEHYKAILLELAIQTRDILFIQKSISKLFSKIVNFEADLEQVLVNDLKFLGIDASQIFDRRPLPETAAFIGFGHYLLQQKSIPAFLGYFYHLESMHPAAGRGYLKALERIGVPKESTSFVSNRSLVNITHNKYLENLIDQNISDGKEEEDFIYSARAAAKLYGQMIYAAIHSVDLNENLSTRHEAHPIAG
ncbi:MAG: iron-containing redox enzyme family protein [Deltaproteobacteria bacterium]|nr:iron-containing redox enzyme family protein [Deltaproteobacteria bacterium]